MRKSGIRAKNNASNCQGKYRFQEVFRSLLITVINRLKVLVPWSSEDWTLNRQWARTKFSDEQIKLKITHPLHPHRIAFTCMATINENLQLTHTYSHNISSAQKIRTTAQEALFQLIIISSDSKLLWKYIKNYSCDFSIFTFITVLSCALNMNSSERVKRSWNALKSPFLLFSMCMFAFFRLRLAF